MPKMRVYELAKQLEVSNKDVLEKLSSLGVTVKSHSSSLEDSDVKRLTEQYKGGKASAPAKSEAPQSAARPAESNSGNAAPRLGPDGKPLRPRLGPDGKPLRPRLGPDGKPMPPRLGPDGKPLRPRLGPDGKPMPPRTGSENRPQEARPTESAAPAADNRPAQTDAASGAAQADAANRPAQSADSRTSQPRQDGRPPYQGQNRQDGRPPYQGGQGGSRPPYQGGGQGGSRPPYQGGQGGSRPPYQGGGQGGRPPYQGGGQGGRGGYVQDKDKDAAPRRPGGQGGRPQRNDKGGPKVVTAADKTDKQQRQQKIEASRRVSKKDRLIQEDEARKLKMKTAPKVVIEPKEPKLIHIPALLTLKELAELMNKSGSELVKSLMKKGQMIAINQEIDYETAAEIAMDYNILAEEKVEVDILEELFGEEPEDDSLKQERPPVVVVMGHVDHGKTSLLDAIRNASVTKGEAGGITQHIGAYTVSINDKPITFLDTPGHEAFTAMRMRGAQVTDIAILVVAADDGVMPQTIEAISHAKAAGVELIVAINKIDKPGANLDRVKRELMEHELVAEEYGGETICVPVSAATKEGIDSLLEMVILVAEMKQFKANANKKARGTVIEAALDKGRGVVATILVQDGTLEIGNPVVAGIAHGKIRAMMDDKGRRVKKAGPSTAVEILGLTGVPSAGDMFYVAASDKQARQVSENIIAKGRVELIKDTPQKVTLEDLFTQIQAGQVKDLNIIIKADVQGSVEAVKQSLEKLSNEEVRVRTILGGVGAITESDVMLSSASNAIIIGFNVKVEPMAKSIADEQGVDVRLYRVIYNAIEDIQAAMNGMLDPVFEEKIIGHAEIRQLFKASGVGTIGGSYVLDGIITRGCQVRVTREGELVFEGELETLKRFKDDVKEVRTNYECGLLFSKFNDIKEGDKVEAYVMEQVKR